MKKYIIGVDIGGTKIAAGITDQKGRLKSKVMIPTFARKGFKTSISQVYKAVNDVIEKSGIKKSAVKGIGVCAPGPLDPVTGIVYNPPNLPGWKNVLLADMMKKTFHKPVALENDANAAGIAEVLWGSAKGYKHVFYVTVSTGIGTAVIIDGKIYHGKNGMAGEGGHATINYDDKRAVCNCGNVGCIETLASGPATVKSFLSKYKKVKNKKAFARHLTSVDKDVLTMKDIGDAAKKGNKYAKEHIEKQAEMIGIWLGSMISVLDPEIIVIGGGVSNSGRIFFDGIKKTIPKHTINKKAGETKVVRARLRHDVGILGAASIMMGETV
ncbi:MAG: ROK family protein [Candidatus Omnitrophota bacterium]